MKIIGHSAWSYPIILSAKNYKQAKKTAKALKEDSLLAEILTESEFKNKYPDIYRNS